MSAASAFRFASPAQWKACVAAGMDAREGTAMRPLLAFACPANPTFEIGNAAAPALTPVGELLWRDDQPMLHRAFGEDERADPAPPGLASSARVIANGAGLWTADMAGRRIICFETASLARRFVVELPGDAIIDIAGDERDGILVLVQRDGALLVHRVDCAGRLAGTASLAGLDAARSFCHVRRPGRFVVLSADGRCIFVFACNGGAPLRRIAAGTLAACFEGAILADDGRSHAFLAGISQEAGTPPRIVALDADVAPVGDIALPEAATGLAADARVLAVTGSRGLYRCAGSDRLSASAAAIEAMLVTPMLDAPDTSDAPRWLRIEASARLPAGTTLEIACFSTADTRERDEVAALLANDAAPAANRTRQLRSRAAAQRVPLLFAGDAAQGDGAATFMMPLFDVTDPYVWVALTLGAGAGSALPAIESLCVRYPGRSLMERLPALYRRAEIQPASFLRSLVGVLEATTDDLDARIEQMGRAVDPRHAAEHWLDFLARWLGLPWDDAMDETQKRCIVQHARRIARGRGTRAGLAALLECLVGDRRGFRIVDVTVDHGIARVGSAECAGSVLPAILCGLPPTATFLGVQAALGSMRLPCAGASDDDRTSRFLGEVRVDIAADAAKRARWDAWLEGVLASMLPAGTRLRIRWLAARAFRGDRLGDDLLLGDPPYGRLGTDAVLGDTRLRPGGSTLPSVQGADGPTLQ